MINVRCEVRWNEQLTKQFKRLPIQVIKKLHQWVRQVNKEGIGVVRQQPGYPDEPLKGARSAQRSIRLNRGYRAVYVMYETTDLKVIYVMEVTKHDY